MDEKAYIADSEIPRALKWLRGGLIGDFGLDTGGCQDEVWGFKSFFVSIFYFLIEDIERELPYLTFLLR